MNLITSTGSCELVLDSEGRNPLARGVPESAQPKAHFILKRYRVDDDGFICLTSSLPLPELKCSVDGLKAELDNLLVQMEERLSETAAKRRIVLPLK